MAKRKHHKAVAKKAKAENALIEALKAELAKTKAEVEVAKATERPLSFKDQAFGRIRRYMRRWEKAFPAVLMGNTYPIPEAVSQDEERWTTEQAKQPYCNPIDHKMGVYAGETAFSRATRIEEMLHAKFSPPHADGEWAKITAKVARRGVVQVAEDYRIKHLAAHSKFMEDWNLRKGNLQQLQFNMRNTLQVPPDPQALVRAFNPYPVEWFVKAVASVYPMITSKRLLWNFVSKNLRLYCTLYDVPPEDEKILNDTINVQLYRTLTAYRDDLTISYFASATLGPDIPGTTAKLPYVTHHLAKNLETLLDKADKDLTASMRNRLDRLIKEREEAERKREAAKNGTDDPMLAPIDWEAIKDSYDPKDGERKDRGYKWRKGSFTGERGALRKKLLETGARMDIEKPPLHRRLLFNWKTKSVARQGIQIRRIENLHLDPFSPPIFSNKAKQNSVHPFVLLDASGSMGITLNDIRTLVENAKGATVAYYSGDDGAHGSVVVVSDKGRFCTQEEFGKHHNGGNTVDFLAYDWVLHNYPGRPIHWVTDQAYTWHKKYNGCSADLTRYAKLHGTKYHRTIEQFISYWKKSASSRR